MKIHRFLFVPMLVTIYYIGGTMRNIYATIGNCFSHYSNCSKRFIINSDWTNRATTIRFKH